MRELSKHKVVFTDFPYLVRLNPNIPWKTRGNASIRISIRTDLDIQDVLEIVLQKSIEYTEEVSKAVKFNRKPGIAITYVENSEKLENFYNKAVKDVIPLDLAIKVAEKYDIIVKGDRGIIGSIAALGFNPDKTGFTYELLTYRSDINEPRSVNEESVIKFDEKNFPYVFANYDYIDKKIQIISHGNDPVLYGVRGVNARAVLSALDVIEVKSKIDGAMLFKTNQATDSHVVDKGTFYQTVKLQIKVSNVKILPGGDVLVVSANGDIILFYKETGELNEAAKLLKKGDEILVTGGIKPSIEYGKIIEAENMVIITLNSYEPVNPKCPKCGGSSESLGKNKGFRCKKCGYRFQSEKQIKEIDRGLVINTIYQSRRYRHLTKPIFLELSHERLDEEFTNQIITKLLYYHN